MQSKQAREIAGTFDSRMLSRNRVAISHPMTARRMLEYGGIHTISFSTRWSSALSNGSVVLEVDVPALLLASLVLERESEDGTSLLDGVLLLSWLIDHALVDGIEGLRGREFGVCETHFGERC